MLQGPVESPPRKRVVLVQIPSLIAEIMSAVADDCNAEVVAEAPTWAEAVRMMREGLAVDLVIAPLASLAKAETEAGLRRAALGVRILAMSPYRRGVAMYELRLLSADVGISSLAEAVRGVLRHAPD